MPQFTYQVTDQDGQQRTGEISAPDLAAARRDLVEQGLVIESLEPFSATASAPQHGSLTSADAEAIVAQVAEIGMANIPMSIGLRAAAAESTSRRVKVALEDLALATERGRPLEDALHADTSRFPAHVGGLIAAASRTAQMGGALEELLAHHRNMRDVRRTVIASVLYPALVIILASAVFLFLMLDIVPIFAKMFEEFELALPSATIALVQISKAFVVLTIGEQKWLMVSVVAMISVGFALIRFVAGAAGWRRFLATAPLFGPLVTWSGAAAFAQMLAVLLDYEIPLPRALELTSGAVKDGNIRETCRQLASGVDAGRTLAESIEENGHLPSTLTAFVRSGEQQGDLPAALKIASEVFVERIGLRASLISSIAPPVIFVFVGLGIAFSVIALFMPLFALISGLS